jgi:hypothetical protein
MMLRKILGLKRVKETVFFTYPNYMIKQMRMRWAGQVAHRILVGKSE